MNLFKAPLTTPDFSLHAKFHGLLNLKRFTASSTYISKSSQTLSHTTITPTEAPLKTPRLFWFPSSFSSTHFYDFKMDAWHSLLDSLEPPHL